MFYPSFPSNWSTLRKMMLYKGIFGEPKPEYQTVSGPIASFVTKRAAPLRSLLVGIDPVQAGTGDPSPDNVRPISGWTEANVWRTGKNLFDISWLDVTGISVTGNTATATASIFSVRFLNGGILPYGTKIDQKVTLTVTAKCNTENQESSIGLVVGFIFLDGSKTTMSVRIPNSQLDWGTYTTTTQGTPENPVVDLFISYSTKGAYEWTVKDIQLELGSTATPYEPYTGNTYTIQLGQTVYGGTLDVTNGVLTVDRVKKKLSELSWTYISETTRFYTTPTGIKNATSWNSIKLASDTYKAGIVTGTAIIDYAFGVTGTAMFLRDTRYTDTTTLEQDMGDVEFVYELATPITIPLTPQEISTLQGQNNVWADSGDVTVEYRSN